MPLVRLAALILSLAAAGELGAQTAACTYDTCALSLVPRLSGLDVVRGTNEQRIGSLGFLIPRDVRAAFSGSAAAQQHAGRALSIRRVAAVFTDVGGLIAAAGAVRAFSTANGRRASAVISLGGVALIGASVLPQFAADAELSRAVRDYNRQFAR